MNIADKNKRENAKVPMGVKKSFKRQVRSGSNPTTKMKAMLCRQGEIDLEDE